jgi:hypothetical protein
VCGVGEPVGQAWPEEGRGHWTGAKASVQGEPGAVGRRKKKAGRKRREKNKEKEEKENEKREKEIEKGKRK